MEDAVASLVLPSMFKSIYIYLAAVFPPVSVVSFAAAESENVNLKAVSSDQLLLVDF